MNARPITGSLPTSIIGLLLLLAPTALFGEGFHATTLVATSAGPRLIEQVAPGDHIISRTETGEATEAVVSAVTKKLTHNAHELIIAGEKILADKNQKFYVVNNGWRTVESLKPGDILVSLDNRTVCIDDVRIGETKFTALYLLSVEEHHNFFVGNPPVLAHNISGAELTAANGITQVALAAFSATGFVITLPAACVAGATSAVVYGVYSFFKHKKNKHRKPVRSTHDASHTHACQRKPQAQAPVQGFLPAAEAQVRPELYPNPAASCGYQEQKTEPLCIGACLPEMKQATLETPASCINQHDQAEQGRLLGPNSTNPVLTPEEMPSCGLQGQTLPSFDAPSEAQAVTGDIAVGEQEVTPHASNETALAPSEVQFESSKAHDVILRPAILGEFDSQGDGRAAILQESIGQEASREEVEPALALVPDVSEFNPTSVEAVEQAIAFALDQNKIKHIFAKKDHGFDFLMDRIGSNEKETVRIILETVAKNNRFIKEGFFGAVIINIAGYEIHVEGVIHDGIIKIGTMYIPEFYKK